MVEKDNFYLLRSNQFLKHMNIPVYDFPDSPILIIGFFGILIAILTLYVTYSKYFNSPLNRDKKFLKNSLEVEFKKISSQVF